MNQTGLDFSKYPYKISELEEINWDGLGFSIHFTLPQDKQTRDNIEKLIKVWYASGDAEEEGGFHYISEYAWSENRSLHWWMDLGSAETTALALLLQSLTHYKDIIKSVEIGRHPSKKEKKFLYEELERSYLGLDYSKYQFKIIELASHDRDYTFTVYFSLPVSTEERSRIEIAIRSWFQNIKVSAVQEDRWIGNFEWHDQQIIAWWMDYNTTRSPALLLLLGKLSQLNPGIDELIIGGKLFPDRAQIRRKK